MGTTHKTGCVLCAQNCGLEIEVENNRIVRVKPVDSVIQVVPATSARMASAR